MHSEARLKEQFPNDNGLLEARRPFHYLQQFANSGYNALRKFAITYFVGKDGGAAWLAIAISECFNEAYNLKRSFFSFLDRE